MFSRRTVLAGSLAAGLHAAGRPARASRLVNDTIEVGCIGTGGRAMHLMGRLAAVPGCGWRRRATCGTTPGRGG